MTDRTSADMRRHVGRLLLTVAPRLAHATRHHLGRMEPSLTYRQYRLLLHVREGARSLTDLRRPATVSMSTLSEVVDSLVRRGLLTRVPSERDRRGIELALTAEGTDALSRAQAAMDDLAAHLLTGTDDERWGVLADILEQLDDSVQQLLAREHDR